MKYWLSGITVGIFLATGLLGTARAGEETPAGGKVEVKLILPNPVPKGTEKEIKLPHMEQESKRPRKPFFAPPGTVLLSEGKPVTSSDSFPVIGELAMVTDGDKETTEGSVLELGPGLQWVQIDLGQPCEVHGVLLWHYFRDDIAFLDVSVRLSDDPDFLEGVEVVYNNDEDNSAKLGKGTDFAYKEKQEGRLIEVKGIMARYVRCYSNGSTSSDLNQYLEVEVYGISK